MSFWSLTKFGKDMTVDKLRKKKRHAKTRILGLGSLIKKRGVHKFFNPCKGGLEKINTNFLVKLEITG